jgi:UbiD family decarboxylase
MAKREEKIMEQGPKGAAIQDLRDWLDRVEKMGDLVRVKEPVSCEEEMSAVSYLVAKQNPSPAILFESVKGYEHSPYKARLLWNILGPSLRRIALTLEEPPDMPTLELIRRVKANSAIESRRAKYRSHTPRSTRTASAGKKSI